MDTIAAGGATLAFVIAEGTNRDAVVNAAALGMLILAPTGLEKGGRPEYRDISFLTCEDCGQWVGDAWSGAWPAEVEAVSVLHEDADCPTVVLGRERAAEEFLAALRDSS